MCACVRMLYYGTHIIITELCTYYSVCVMCITEHTAPFSRGDKDTYMFIQAVVNEYTLLKLVQHACVCVRMYVHMYVGHCVSFSCSHFIHCDTIGGHMLSSVHLHQT